MIALDLTPEEQAALKDFIADLGSYQHRKVTEIRRCLYAENSALAKLQQALGLPVRL